MNKHPPKKERLAMPGEPSQNEHQLRRLYKLLSIVQAPFEKAFWKLEQEKARIQDRLSQLEVVP